MKTLVGLYDTSKAAFAASITEELRGRGSTPDAHETGRRAVETMRDLRAGLVAADALIAELRKLLTMNPAPDELAKYPAVLTVESLSGLRDALDTYDKGTPTP